MTDEVVKYYVNLDAGLLIKASFTPKHQLIQCIGKKVQVEICEMNTICINGKDFYDLQTTNPYIYIITPIKPSKSTRKAR